MARRHKLPGISEENTSRRNMLFGTAYVVATAGCIGIAARGGPDEDDTEQSDDTDTEASDESDGEGVGTPKESDDEDVGAGPGLLWDDHLDSEFTRVGLSPDGNTVVCAKARDVIAVYTDADRNDVELPTSGLIQQIRVINSELVYIKFSRALGLFDIDGGLRWGFDVTDLWWSDVTQDGRNAAMVTSPVDEPGRVGLVEDGEVAWETELSESVGFHVAVSGDTVVAGTEEYWTGDGLTGTPGVELYADGQMQWKHETEWAVISVSIHKESDLIVAGTDDSQVFAFNLDGDLQWSLSDAGPFCAISEDGSTVVVSTALFGDQNPLTAYSVDGSELWSIETPIAAKWPRDLVVSEDGRHILLNDSVESQVALVSEGELVWHEEMFDGNQGGVSSGLSADGSTWTVVSNQNEEDGVFVETYGFVTSE